MTRVLLPDMPARRLPDLDALQVSRAIGLARLICILGIVYVHAWTGLGGDQMMAQAGSPQDMLRWVFVELFGRASVPLLSVISGWLVADSLARRSARQLIARKARTVLLPMLLWNALATALVVGAALSGWPNMPLPDGPLWLADNLLSLTRPADINVQTYFLRDLFLCMLAAPWLVRLPASGLVVVMAASAAWTVGGWNLYLLLRPAILFFFVAGIAARRYGAAERIGAWPFWAVALPFLLVLPFKIGLSMAMEKGGAYPSPLVNMIDLTMRASAALLVWRAMLVLAQHRAGVRMLALERYAFFLFCSHLLFMWLIAPLIGIVTGPMGSPGWPLFFLTQPLLVLGFAMLLARAIDAVSPQWADLLGGGRLR